MNNSNKVFNILSYIWLLFIVALFIPNKDDKDVKFHCGQGIILFIFTLAAGIIAGIVSAILIWIPFVGPILVWILTTLLSLVSLALMIIGIINAATDKQRPLPIIGKYAFYK